MYQVSKRAKYRKKLTPSETSVEKPKIPTDPSEQLKKKLPRFAKLKGKLGL